MKLTPDIVSDALYTFFDVELKVGRKVFYAIVANYISCHGFLINTIFPQDDRCQFFTRNVMANTCYLKVGYGTRISLNAYYVSGPKYCGYLTGEIHFKIQ